MPPGLNERQKTFVREYLIDFDATKAAKRSGYKGKRVGQTAYENLKKPEIQKAIKDAVKKRAERTEIKQDRILLELKCLAFSDLSKIAKWGSNGVTLRESIDLPKSARRAVESVSETSKEFGRDVKIKLHSKTKALELLMRHLGMLNSDDDEGVIFKLVHSVYRPKCEKSK